MPRRNDIAKILIIGSGPIVIGQSAEFDYSGTQACKALKAEGYEVVLANSNPATIMTDPEMADRTYIEPLTKTYLEEIIRREVEMMQDENGASHGKFALLPTVGGQTALNLAVELADSGVLEKYNVELIGAQLRAIERLGDDRQEVLPAPRAAQLRRDGQEQGLWRLRVGTVGVERDAGRLLVGRDDLRPLVDHEAALRRRNVRRRIADRERQDLAG